MNRLKSQIKLVTREGNAPLEFLKKACCRVPGYYRLE